MSVRCPNGHENEDGSLFCDECGERLVAPVPAMGATMPPASSVGAGVPCPSCGASNPPGELFCSNCGTSLSAPAPAMQAAAPAAPDLQPAVSAAPVAAAPSFTASPAAAAQVEVRAKLVVKSDNVTLDLPAKPPEKEEPDEVRWLLGREDSISNIYPDIDLTPYGAEEGGVGRRHAQIIYKISTGQYTLQDLTSINYTFLTNKSKRLDPKIPEPLEDGDEIRLGRVALRFKTS